MSTFLSFPEALAGIPQGGQPDPALIRRAFDAILQGQWTPVQVAGLLVALRMLPDSAGTITAASASMRAAMVPVHHDLPLVLDTCGTGGDGQGTLNLSTGAAIVVAACGVPVAKHGNRAVSSRSGSADVLDALGIALDVPTQHAAALLKDVGIAFLLAPAHHPAMRHAMAARKELGVRTLFNQLGPLNNPAGATHQLLGAYADELRPLFARTLAELGARRAWVVRGEDGLDEVSPFVPTRVTELDNGQLRERTVTPGDFGLPVSPAGAIAGGDATYNAKQLELILDGQPHPARDALLLNAAAALVVALELPLRDATERARRALDEGAARHTLERWRARSGELRAKES